MRQLRDYQVNDSVLLQFIRFGTVSSLKEQSQMVKTYEEIGIPLLAIEQALFSQVWGKK